MLSLFSSLLLAFPVCAQSSRVVEFAAKDGVRLQADYRPARKAAPVIVMLHGVGASRREWDPIVPDLQKLGFGVLQFDARGHGASGGAPYSSYRTAQDWLALGQDLDAAIDFLKKNGVPEGRIGLMGASIGANLSLRAALAHPKIPFAVLLSPGWDYRGVESAESFLRFQKPLLYAASADDPYSAETCRRFSLSAKNRAALFIQGGSGHGVQMFSGEVNRRFRKELLRWLSGRAASSRRSAKKT
ncbi:MAG: alpha/beta fold hydrolase [Elusimicrobiota bacterium]|jgi:alpha-beta hydrolase superfamily lysophospholipase